MILVFGTAKDEHVTRVVAAGRRLGLDHIVIDYLERTPVSLALDKRGAHCLAIGDRRVTGPVLIWDRLKIFASHLAISGDERDALYESQEWHAFFNLLGALFNDHVVNSPQSRMCMVKPYQQTVAATCGFLVPPTRVTNSKDDALSFSQLYGPLVLKSLSSVPVMPNESDGIARSSVMTMVADHGSIQSADDDEIGLCPHFFQQKIPKAYEVRAVVVAGVVFAFRIDSQRFRSSSTDWRHAIPHLDFHPIQLGDAIEGRLRRFMQALGLFSGSFDLIVDLDGECWFLECNQDGQWSWLDVVVDGAIADAFARAFAHRLQEQAASRSHLCRWDGA